MLETVPETLVQKHGREPQEASVPHDMGTQAKCKTDAGRSGLAANQGYGPNPKFREYLGEKNH